MTDPIPKPPPTFEELVRAYNDARAAVSTAEQGLRAKYPIIDVEPYREAEALAFQALLAAHAEVAEQNEWLKKRNHWLNAELEKAQSEIAEARAAIRERPHDEDGVCLWRSWDKGTPGTINCNHRNCIWTRCAKRDDASDHS